MGGCFRPDARRVSQAALAPFAATKIRREPAQEAQLLRVHREVCRINFSATCKPKKFAPTSTSTSSSSSLARTHRRLADLSNNEGACQVKQLRFTLFRLLRTTKNIVKSKRLYMKKKDCDIFSVQTEPAMTNTPLLAAILNNDVRSEKTYT